MNRLKSFLTRKPEVETCKNLAKKYRILSKRILHDYGILEVIF